MGGLFKKNGLLAEMYSRYREHEIQASGAQLSYFLLLSIFPCIMFLMAVLGYLSLPVDDVLHILSVIVPQEVIDIIDKYIEYLLVERKGHLLLTSAIVAMWTASNSLSALTAALNKAYRIRETRSYVRRKLLTVPFMVLLTASIAIALFIPILGRGFLIWLSYFVPISGVMIDCLVYLRWLLAVFTVFNIITIVYYIVPNMRLKLRELMPGAAFATFGWILISVGFSIYVRTVSGYAVMYGSVGAIIILMVWLFLGADMIILGGELNAAFRERKLDNRQAPAANGPGRAAKAGRNVKAGAGQPAGRRQING